MKIPNSIAFASSQISGPNPQKKQEQLASALKAIGVDDTQASKVVGQVKTAVDGLEKSDRGASTERSVVIEVLETNGIDAAAVNAEIQAGRSQKSGRTQSTGRTPGSGRSQGAGTSQGSRPSRGPRPPKEEQTAVESALTAANVDESDVTELLGQIIEAIGELTTDETTSASEEAVLAKLTEILEENDVDVERFEQAFGESLGQSGSFFDRLA